MALIVMRGSSGDSGAVPASPTNRNGPIGRPNIVWVDDLRVVRPDQPPQHVRETWVTADLDDGAWTIGYRVVTIAGAPLIAEQRTWQTSSPPWAPLPLAATDAPGTPLSLDRAQRRLSEKRALEAWRDNNESIDAGAGALQPVARWFGFDPQAPLRARPDDDYYVDVAVKYVKHKGLAPASPHVGLAVELGITQDQSRKRIHVCRNRQILDGDELTTYARAIAPSEAADW